jgi:hypothetical protein
LARNVDAQFRIEFGSSRSRGTCLSSTSTDLESGDDLDESDRCSG